MWSGLSLPGAISPCPEGDSNKSSIGRSRSSASEQLVERVDTHPVPIGQYFQRLPAFEPTLFGQFTKFGVQRGGVRRIMLIYNLFSRRNENRKLTDRLLESVQ